MPWGFERGHLYSRQQDIHVRFAGQERDGIITPSAHRLILATSGTAGEQYGYADRFHENGLVEYFGRGQVDDMEMKAGNKAIARHAQDGEDLLLFRVQDDGRLLFHGEMVCQGWHHERANDRNGRDRQAIVFELLPIEQVAQAVDDAEAPIGEVDMNLLRQRAYAAAEVDRPGYRAERNIYERSRDVRDYVLARANGICEGCGEPAPFARPNRAPYLEPHHIHKRSDGGPDHPKFVIALDPTCHRRVHFGADGNERNAGYLAAMAHIEPRIWV